MKMDTHLDVDNSFISVTNDLDTTFFLLLIECLELSLLLPVIDGLAENLVDYVGGQKKRR